MKKIVLVVVAATLASIAQARLGETNVQIYHRYGAVRDRSEVATNIWVGTYLFKDYLVLVYFENNVSVAETVGPMKDRDFSGVERHELMDDIGGSTNWVADSAAFHFTSERWTTPDGRVLAFLNKRLSGSQTLTVVTRNFAREFEALTQKKEKAKASGF